MLNRRLLAPALLAAALLPQAARAAEAESSVTGQGDATIKKGAEAIRLTVALQVEGSSVHDAVAKLKTRREAVKAALVKLSAADPGPPDMIEKLPESLRDLISRSMNLQARVRRLDLTIHTPTAERAPIGNPLVPQLNRLKAAFERQTG